MEEGPVDVDAQSGGVGLRGRCVQSMHTFVRAHAGILISIGLVLLTVGVYLPALDALLVADDFLIVNRWHLPDAVRSLHDTVGFGRNEYRPVIAFSYALSNSFWQGASRGYHFDSVLLHAINAALLFLFIRLLTGSAAISGMAAVFFSIHPIHAERVVWITARDSLISTLFTFLVLIAYALSRQRDGKESGSSSSSVKMLSGLSFAFLILGLLSYEGTVVAPGILVMLEFLFYSKSEKLWSRLWASIVRARWYWIIVAGYLAWWMLLFRGEVRQYNMSYAAGNIIHNCYKYLYQLFYDNSRIYGILYFALLVSAFFLMRKQRPLAFFSLSWMLLAFIPFVGSIGFADRFAYAGTAGYAIFLSLLIYACAVAGDASLRRTIQFPARLLALFVFVILGICYFSGLQTRISDWKAAGEIADRIPRQIKALHPDLPDGITLVLARIPQMHGHAYVFPLGLDYAIGRLYPGRNLRVLFGPGERDMMVPRAGFGGAKILYFTYDPDQRAIEETVVSGK